MVNVEIDPNSGFCFGVIRAIELAESYLKKGESLSSVGEIVHNAEEVRRLNNLGIQTITCDDIQNAQSANLLIRAHGEPPSTYLAARQNGKNIVDATCPIVLKLQQNIKKAFEQHSGAQIVIYGKPKHAEVIGLRGQTNYQAIVLSSPEEISKLNADVPVILFSQTTMSIEGLEKMKKALYQYMRAEVTVYDTICRKVSNRIPEIKKFAAAHDVCIFVSGKNSSNGRMLYEACKTANTKTFFISQPSELNETWFTYGMNVGVCGATSTPQWLMKDVKKAIEEMAT